MPKITESGGTVSEIPMPITCMVERENYHYLVSMAQKERELVRNTASRILNAALLKIRKEIPLA